MRAIPRVAMSYGKETNMQLAEGRFPVALGREFACELQLNRLAC